MAVILQEADLASLDDVKVEVPAYMAEVVASISQLARQSPQVNQRSGVSVRLGVANYETLVAAAARRALRLGEKEAVPRVSDLAALVSPTAGKVELDSLDEASEEDLVGRLTRQAVLGVFRSSVEQAELTKAVSELDDGSAIEVGDDVPSSSYVEALALHPGLRAPAGKLAVLKVQRLSPPRRSSSSRGCTWRSGSTSTRRRVAPAIRPGGHEPVHGALAAAMPGAMYSRWDGTQEPGDLSGDDVLRRLMDDLTEHGDPDQALRRLMQQGFMDSSGKDVAVARVRRTGCARRAQLAREAFSELQTAMSNASPAALQHAREMLSELNRLAERRREGEDVEADFERFMARVLRRPRPGHPANLDELLENMARQVAAAREFESLTPEQRAKLMELSEALLEGDLELQMELESLAAHLEARAGWEPVPGDAALLEPAGALISQLSDSRTWSSS